jgi:hypothetical protein
LASHQSRSALFAASSSNAVPAVEGAASRQQSLEFRVGAAPAEDVSHIIEVARQEFAGEIQHQLLAETELALVGNRHVVVAIRDVVTQLILDLVNTGNVGAVIELAGAPAQDRVIGAGIAACDEFERERDVLKWDGRGLVAPAQVSGADT